METRGGKRGTIAQGLWPRFIIHFYRFNLDCHRGRIESRSCLRDFREYPGTREKEKEEEEEKEERKKEKLERRSIERSLTRCAMKFVFHPSSVSVKGSAFACSLMQRDCPVIRAERNYISAWNIVPGVRTIVFSNRLKSDLLRNS